MKLYKILYSKKYRDMGARYHGRHCIVLAVGKRPKNCLVKLRGGELVVVPSGNLKSVGVWKGGVKNG